MVARTPDKGWGATRTVAIAMLAAALLPQLHVAAQEVGADDDESAVETATFEFGDTFDWVRVVSGEWLKGELKGMRDGKLEFDSDKFDAQDIDFREFCATQCAEAPERAFIQTLALKALDGDQWEVPLVELKDSCTG